MVDKTAVTTKLKVKNEQRCNVNVVGLSLKIKLMKLIKLQSKNEQRCDVNVLGLSLKIRLMKRIKTMFKSLFKDPVFTMPKWGFTLATGSSWRFHNSIQQRCAGG